MITDTQADGEVTVSSTEINTEQPTQSHEPALAQESEAKPTLAPRPANSLSPSRAGDFLTCGLRYRLRVIDQIPEPPGEAAARGTLVHSVLEKLYDHPAEERTEALATELLSPSWRELREQDPLTAAVLFGSDTAWDDHLAGKTLPGPDADAEAAFVNNANSFLTKYFRMEDPKRLEPHQREVPVSVTLPSGLTLRGVVDRVDRAPNGAVRVVDYKTGRAPGEGWESKAMFQMRFYGLVWWLTTSELPARLQLLYLGNEQTLAIDPTEEQLLATQKKLESIGVAIAKATEREEWRPRKSQLCSWCSFKPLCPEWGGTTPAIPSS